MPTRHIFLFILVSSLTVQAQRITLVDPTRINDELTFQQINENTYMITHYFPWAANSLVVITDQKHAVLIDTPYEREATKVLLDWIRDKFGDLKISAIVTGFHQDNLGGNKVLINRGIPVYGMTLTANLVESEGPGLMEEIYKSVKNNENSKYLSRYKNLKLSPPDHTFDLESGQNKKLEIGGETFDFFFPGESHTVDNTIVYLPNQDILFGGCMIRALSDQSPGFIKYANMQAWPISVQKVIDKYPDVQIVIPGHGSVGDHSLLDHTVQVLEKWNNEH